MHKTRMAIVGATIAIALALGGGIASAADGYFYIYNGPNFGGTVCRWFGNDADYRYNSNGGGCNMNVNDWASSWWNNGYAGYLEDVNVREHINYGGADFCVPNGYAYPYLGWWDNRASSHFWSNNC